MARVGNSLDNRDIEFWFSIFKTELIYRLDIKRMSFVQLRQTIADYIYYYNNVRIQKNWTGWHQFNIKINYNKKHEIWIFVQILCPSLPSLYSKFMSIKDKSFSTTKNAFITFFISCSKIIVFLFSKMRKRMLSKQSNWIFHFSSFLIIIKKWQPLLVVIIS